MIICRFHGSWYLPYKYMKKFKVLNPFLREAFFIFFFHYLCFSFMFLKTSQIDIVYVCAIYYISYHDHDDE